MFHQTVPSRHRGPGTPGRRILAPGRNCWGAISSDRAKVLIGPADYFSALNSALACARRSILIIGRDFDAGIRLAPAAVEDLGQMLRRLVEERPGLHVHILASSLATLPPSRTANALLAGSGWQNHSRIGMRLETRHLLYGARHQKIVVIDDRVAFVGGVDLAAGMSCCPMHDTQLVFDGRAAAAAGDLVRERWLAATEEELVPPASAPPIWPVGLVPDFMSERIAIARTAPRLRRMPPAREGAALVRDAIAAARRHVYIEAQHLTARYMHRAIRRSLRQRNGPEIVVILGRSANGLIERMATGRNSERMVRNLARADRHGRFRAYTPVVPGPEGPPVPHTCSRLIIVDEDFIHVGASNPNNRSLGVDIECDVAIEASNDQARERIARIRTGLLAEHLGASQRAVASAMLLSGSMITAIEELDGGERGLRCFAAGTAHGRTRSPAHWVRTLFVGRRPASGVETPLQPSPAGNTQEQEELRRRRAGS